MNKQHFEEILIEARKRHKRYLDMDSQATNVIDNMVRKEDMLEYWIAVVTKEASHGVIDKR